MALYRVIHITSRRSLVVQRFGLQITHGGLWDDISRRYPQNGVRDDWEVLLDFRGFEAPFNAFVLHWEAAAGSVERAEFYPERLFRE